MTLARMTQGTMIATVSVDMAVAATKIAGLVGMMKDAMMKDAMMTGVTMSAAMTNGDTEVDQGVGGEDAQKFQQCLGSFDSVHNPSIVDSRPRYLFCVQFSVYRPAVRRRPIHLLDIDIKCPTLGRPC